MLPPAPQHTTSFMQVKALSDGVSASTGAILCTVSNGISSVEAKVTSDSSAPVTPMMLFVFFLVGGDGVTTCTSSPWRWTEPRRARS